MRLVGELKVKKKNIFVCALIASIVVSSTLDAGHSGFKEIAQTIKDKAIAAKDKVAKLGKKAWEG